MVHSSECVIMVLRLAARFLPSALTAAATHAMDYRLSTVDSNKANKKAPDHARAFYRFRLGSKSYSHLSSVSSPFLLGEASAPSRSCA